MTDAQVNLLREWRNPEYCQLLIVQRKITTTLGQQMTREQADKFEAIPWLFAGPPSPSMTGQARAHFDKKEIWKVVWRFCEAHPMFFSESIDGILNNFDIARELDQQQ
jgi:hypothetical protein